ncbi:MAG: hypothetical protein HFJ28_05480 [Clostridia bacterium]|nr:hypothetical protein [Clostridia bacterium]
MLVINSTDFAVKVNSDTLLAGQEMEFPLGEGEQIFIASANGISTVELSGATLKENTTGDLSVGTVGTSMLIINIKN